MGDVDDSGARDVDTGESKGKSSPRRRSTLIGVGAASILLVFFLGLAMGRASSRDDPSQEAVEAGDSQKAVEVGDSTPVTVAVSRPSESVPASIPAPLSVEVESIEDDGPAFVESFDERSGMERFEFDVHHRSDHDPGINYPAEPNERLRTDAFQGDHVQIDDDGNCSAPTEQRTLVAQNRMSAIYWCDVSEISGSIRGNHMMTAMGHVDGYSTVAFSPKQSFESVSSVCWDVNQTDMGGRQWIAVVITPDFEHGGLHDRDGRYHLASGTLNPDGVDRTGALPAPETVAFRFGGRYSKLAVLRGGTPISAEYDHGYIGQGTDAEALGSRAVRRGFCITENGDGTVTIEVEREADSFRSVVPVSLPPHARVVFEDHTYTPDKDPRTCADDVQPGLDGCRYTWHWDNIEIST